MMQKTEFEEQMMQVFLNFQANLTFNSSILYYVSLYFQVKVDYENNKMQSQDLNKKLKVILRINIIIF